MVGQRGWTPILLFVSLFVCYCAAVTTTTPKEDGDDGYYIAGVVEHTPFAIEHEYVNKLDAQKIMLSNLIVYEMHAHNASSQGNKQRVNPFAVSGVSEWCA